MPVVQPGLRPTWLETLNAGFLMTWLILGAATVVAKMSNISPLMPLIRFFISFNTLGRPFNVLFKILKAVRRSDFIFLRVRETIYGKIFSNTKNDL